MTAHRRPADQPSEFLTIAEAAARYHVSRDFIRHRIVDGSLPAVRSGRRVIRISASELDHIFRPIHSIGAPRSFG